MVAQDIGQHTIEIRGSNEHGRVVNIFGNLDDTKIKREMKDIVIDKDLVKKLQNVSFYVIGHQSDECSPDLDTNCILYEWRNSKLINMYQDRSKIKIFKGWRFGNCTDKTMYNPSTKTIMCFRQPRSVYYHQQFGVFWKHRKR